VRKLYFTLLFFMIIGMPNSFAQRSNSSFFDQEEKKNIEIYPNPSTEFLYVKVTDSSLEDIQFELHSIIGNQLETTVEEIKQGVYRISVANLTKGYYFIILTDEDARFKQAFKFLKQ